MTTKAQTITKLRAKYPNAEILAEGTILWEGWELDNYMFLIRDEGTKKLIGTDHGGIVEYKVKELADAIHENNKSTISLENLINLYETKDGK